MNLSPRQLGALLIPGAAVLLCLPAAPASAGGTSIFASLRSPTTPEQTAWGGAMAAGGLGPDALRGNPAALARGTSFLLAASHRSWQHGLRQEWAGGRLRVGSTWLGAELSAVHAGELEGYDEQGIPTGSFQPIEVDAGAGAAVRIAPSLALGVAIHGLFLGSSGASVRGWSGDVGVQLAVASHDFGLAVRHFGPSVAGDLGDYPLPTEIALGGLHALPAGLEASWTAAIGRAGKRQVHGGIRWRASQALAVLAGGRWSHEERPLRPSAGVEFDVSSFRLAYGFVPDEELGATHQVLVALRRPSPATPPSPAIEPPAASSRQRAQGAEKASERTEVKTSDAAPRPEAAAPTTRLGEASQASRGDQGAKTAPQRLEPAAPAAPAPESQSVHAEPRTVQWSLWGGRHRSAESALAEVRAWRAEGISTGEVIPQPDGSYRVRLRAGLTRAEAERLARSLGAHARPDTP